MGDSRTRRGWTYVAGLALVAAAFFSVPGERGLTPLSNEPLGRAENGRPPAPAVVRGGTADAFAAARQPEFADGALFAFAQPDHAAALDSALPAPARAVYYVRLNSQMIAGKQSPFWQAPGAGRLTVPLPDGGTLSVVIDGSVMLGSDRFTSTGRIEGRPHSRAVFAWSGGFLSASFEDAELGTFALRAADGEYSQFYQLDPAQILPCGGGRLPVIDAAALAAAARRRAGATGGDGTAGNASMPGTAAAQNPQRAEVHVMIAYTPSVRSSMTGLARTNALQSDFDAALARVNSIFDASLITARVKLVRIHETQYNEALSAANAVQDEALTAVQSATDGKMDEVLVIRDQSGADVVCLVLGRRDTQSSGLSYILNTPGDTTNALFAYSIVEHSNIAGANVLAHELGHVFGCAHDRENSSNAGSHPYSYGYQFVGADGRRYHDIMSYPFKTFPPGTELNYFSNPNVIVPPPVNVPIGIAPGLPGESATALTIEQSAFEVSMFRLQTQAAPNPGHLINVATRAFVGAGDQVLIAGFVINGSPKRMLLRAAGPALAGFGVTGALANPRLQIFSGQLPVAANDDWEVQQIAGGAGEVTLAAQQSGAFPFASGSADAALLVTLTSGAYTAVVEGEGGTTGFGLVEAYEVGRESNKIVNLSTRGYADNQGREMIGGFVVEGTAGATKRILVRVLGPTLGRPPFNMTGVMEDPMMEIYNSAGELLIRNDDWSTDSRFVGGRFDDFQPLTPYYSEQQIAATGRAPSNRREPCVLVDLPPGNYTVVAKPFELRSSNPSEEQSARPGVGIVEVYEINP